MKNSIIAILLLSIVVCSCDLNNDDVPPPSLPLTVFGQLPTRSDIIQTAEAVGAKNVQIISYQIATGTSQKITGGVTTNGGIQPSWWRSDRSWATSGYIPTLAGVKVVYDETGKMHPDWSVRYAINKLFENAGFKDATWGPSCPVEVETITDSRWRLIPLPTHAHIINAVEQLGASNVKINLYVTVSVDFWLPPPITISWYTLYYMHIVPADSSFNAVQGDVAHTNPRMLRLSYEHPGLGSIITNNDVEGTIRELFKQYGFESIDVETTGTKISSDFPLPSFNQIRQAAEQAGASNVQVNMYKANNVDVIPMNEGSRLAAIPVIVEINYDGPAMSAVNTNVRALFANFNNVHIGNNATATIPLPTGSNIRQTVLGVLYFPASLTYEPSIYTANGISISIISSPGSAAWNAMIRIVMNGDGTNTAADANNAVQALIRLFNERGFFNLDIAVSNR
jgi:hypothetical protein